MKMSLSRFLQWPGNILIYKTLGWDLCFYYMLLLGKVYFLIINRKESQEINRSIETVFRDYKRPSEIKAISKGVFRGMLCHYYEKLFNAYEDIEGLKNFFERSIRADFLWKLDDALEKGNGALFVTGHYGGIEYIPIFLAVNQYPVSVVAKFKTKGLKDTLYLKTRDLGLKIVDAGQHHQILTSIIKELRINRIVFIECDEIKEWRPDRKEKTFFLRKLIGVDRTINIIIKRSEAEVVFGILHRITLQNYKLIIENYQNIVHGIINGPSTPAEAILNFFEPYIFYYPEEWYQWKHYLRIPAIGGFTSQKTKPVPIRAVIPILDEQQVLYFQKVP